MNDLELQLQEDGAFEPFRSKSPDIRLLAGPTSLLYTAVSSHTFSQCPLHNSWLGLATASRELTVCLTMHDMSRRSFAEYDTLTAIRHYVLQADGSVESAQKAIDFGQKVIELWLEFIQDPANALRAEKREEVALHDIKLRASARKDPGNQASLKVLKAPSPCLQIEGWTCRADWEMV